MLKRSPIIVKFRILSLLFAKYNVPGHGCSVPALSANHLRADRCLSGRCAISSSNCSIANLPLKKGNLSSNFPINILF